jgi:hypothetical protein
MTICHSRVKIALITLPILLPATPDQAPAELRTAPLWAWTDEMDPERLKGQLRQFKERGIWQGRPLGLR